MLKEIKVKNLAIIEDISLSFNNGFTALTGETGAGKSLIIDAIGLVLGFRADTDLVRYGEKEAVIEAIFTEASPELLEVLEKFGINKCDEITIKRVISANSKCSINETPVTVNVLRQIGLFLGDIHVQHDTYRLINKDNYLSFLDDFRNNKFNKLLSDYQVKKLSYESNKANYLKIKQKNRELNQKVDFLEFTKQELEELNLEEDLDIKLEEEITKLSNFDKIYSALNESYELLNSERFVRDDLYEAFDKLNGIKDFDDDYKKAYDTLSDAYYQIEDISTYLYKAKDSLDFDPDYLDELNNRLYEINKVKEKYHKSNNELIKYLEEITLELNLVTNYEETIKELEDDLKGKYESLKEASLKLSEFRKQEALVIEKALIKECKELDLENTNFKVSFNDPSFADYLDSSIFKDNGIDDIDFKVSFNIGEPVLSLSKVASGGELSRLMLAFKILYLNKNNLQFMVFDEIDSGISGQTARKIGKKLNELSKKVQVLAITHLAQVASLADTQAYIRKDTISGRTKTRVDILSYEERIQSLAIMLSGIEASQALLETAKKMLENK